jgi:hypothetical protein
MKLRLSRLNLQILGHEIGGKDGKEEFNQIANTKAEI